MARSLFLVLISLLSVVFNPIMLAATDDVEVSSLNPAGIVETVPLPEPEPIVAEEPAAPVAGVYVAPTFNYTVTINVGSRKEYNDTAFNLSYADIYRFKSMVYGHNSANLLGNLAYATEGSVITVNEGAISQSYRVSSIVYYAKTADGYLNGDPYLVDTISKTAMGHSIAFMTCAGKPLGNGDATHRLVVYADAV